MDKLAIFCENPSGTNFRNLSEMTQRVLNAIAEYSVEHQKGNVERAMKIRKIFTASKIGENIKRGVRALFLLMYLLKTPQFTKITEHQSDYPRAKISLTTGDNFVISYGTDLPNMFLIKQKVETLGVDMDVSLYEDRAKQYFLDAFAAHPDMEIYKITVFLSDDVKKDFYDSRIGLTWNNEECAKCIKILTKNKVSHSDYKKCEALVKKCASKIRYRPIEIGMQSAREKHKHVLHTGKSSASWECQACLLENPGELNACMACETPRE